MKNIKCTEDLRGIELEAQINLLNDLLLKAYREKRIYPEQILNSKEICKIMSWKEHQFRYRIPELKKYGLLNVGRTYRMSYYNLQRYIGSLYNKNEI